MTSTTLEDFLGMRRSMQLSAAKIAEAALDIFKSALGIGTNTQPPNPGETPRIIRTPWGEEFGYLVNMSFFPDIFPPEQRDLINYSDVRNKSIHFNDFRKMGGVYDRHPLDILHLDHQISQKITPQIAAKYGMSPEEAFALFFKPERVIADKRHDDFEDHSDIFAATKDFKALRKKARDIDPDLTENTDEKRKMEEARIEVKKVRERVIKDEYGLQTAAIGDITKKLSISDTKNANLILVGDYAIGAMDWMGRHVEQNHFHTSVAGASEWHRFADYIKEGKGGPFQVTLAERLSMSGRKSGSLTEKDLVKREPLEYYLLRIYLRGLDRIANSRERKPNYGAKQVKKAETIFAENEWLSLMYGPNFRFRVKENLYEQGTVRIDNGMSRPDIMEMLYRNAVVVKFMDDALNVNGWIIAKSSQRNPVLHAYLLGILEARDLIVKESKLIVEELSTSYESDLGTRAERIANKAKSLRPSRLAKIDGDGPVSRGYRYDADIEGNPETKFGEITNNYEDVIVYGRLFDLFATKPTHEQMKTGRFHLFSFYGMSASGIQFTSHARP